MKSIIKRLIINENFVADLGFLHFDRLRSKRATLFAQNRGCYQYIMNANELYIGIMSGTSLDGIEAVLVDFQNHKLKELGLIHQDFPTALRSQLLNLLNNPEINLLELGEIHTHLGQCYAKAVDHLLKKTGVSKSQIKAIGNHGQTVFHHPYGAYPFTLQIGNNSVLAAQTGITVVGDFRSMDVAHGGQGAPLAPIFHQAFLAKPHKNIAVLNLGGIANISILHGEKLVAAFDTGPANGLLDAFMQKHFNKPYDKNGDTARQGKIESNLLNQLLDDPYFKKDPPKSTGKEYFNLEHWDLNNSLDTLTTLTELTAQIITDALQGYQIDELLVTGGGAFNRYLIERLCDLNQDKKVFNIQDQGIHPQAIEPLAFAYLAKLRMDSTYLNLAAITGSNQPVLLGQPFF